MDDFDFLFLYLFSIVSIMKIYCFVEKRSRQEQLHFVEKLIFFSCERCKRCKVLEKSNLEYRHILQLLANRSHSRSKEKGTGVGLLKRKKLQTRVQSPEKMLFLIAEGIICIKLFLIPVEPQETLRKFNRREVWDQIIAVSAKLKGFLI